MNKQCQKCGDQFTLSDSYLKFLQDAAPVFVGKKYSIGEPSLCSDCREQRRLAWRNERFMYKRTCAATGKSIVSMYPPDSPFIVYDPAVWWGIVGILLATEEISILPVHSSSNFASCNLKSPVWLW